jgi:hypothetical protein
VFECALAGSLDDWAVGDWVAEGDTEFDGAGASFDGRENNFARGGEIRISAGNVGD